MFRDRGFYYARGRGGKPHEPGRLRSLVVGLARDDAVSTVNLLEEDDSHELVREGHGGEAELIVGTFQDLVGETEGTTDDEADVGLAGESEGIDFVGEFRRGKPLSVNCKCNQVGRIGDFGEQALAFFLLDLGFFDRACVVGCLLVGDFYDAELTVSGEAFCVFVDCVAIELLFDLTDTIDRDVHVLFLSYASGGPGTF